MSVKNYLRLSKEYQNFKIINGNQPKESISQEVARIADKLIDERKDRNTKPKFISKVFDAFKL